MAERTITDDLEYLIQHTVDRSKADYAVVTGVQVLHIMRSVRSNARVGTYLSF